MGKDKATVKRTYARYRAITRPNAGLFAADVAASIGLIALVSFANPFIMARVVDRIAAGPVAPDQVIAVFGPFIAAFIVVNVVGQLCSKFVDYATWKLQIRANYRIATLCFDTLANQSMTFHSERMGGALVSQTTKFMNAYAMLLENLVYAFVPIVCSAVFTVCILAPEAPVFVAILAVLMVAYAVFAYRMYASMMPFNRNAAGAYNRLLGQLSDSVTNIMAVKTYGREGAERARFDEANDDVLVKDSARMRASTLRGLAVAGVIVAICILLSIFVTGGNAWFGIAPGTLVMMFTYTYTLTTQFDRIGMMLQQTNRALGDAHEMTEILDAPRLVEDVPDAAELAVSAGAIDFENIGFAYASTPKVDRRGDSPSVHFREERRVFDGFELHIPAGQRIGLVGRSGAGKTTLTALLLRLADIQQGRILVDGQDIAHCTQESLRRQIAYVPQEALLFHRSIRENIAYGRPDATDEQIEQAARLACAWEFIEQMPEELDTEVGERGTTLSGGQRQRIAIARAILADAPILVLDEATSALDSESERAVQEALANLMRGRTAIVVAHRLSTVAGLDRIVVLDQGRIVEDGAHDELVAASGEYASLWNYQTGFMK